MTESPRSTRRRFLKATATTGATAGLVGTVTAQNQQVATSYILGGHTSGWRGREPASISGQTNPPLRLQAGQQYEVTWENVDGAPHNIVIQNGQGETLLRTELISEEGATQTVTFTAEEAMTEYYCQAHPNSMRGPIELGAGGDTQQNTTTINETDTITTEGSSQAGQAGQVDAADDTTTAVTTTPAQTTTTATTTNETTTNETTETETTIGTFTASPEEDRQTVQADAQPTIKAPGFGSLTALAGITGGMAYLLGKNTDDTE